MYARIACFACIVCLCGSTVAGVGIQRRQRKSSDINLPVFHKIAVDELFKTKQPQVLATFLHDTYKEADGHTFEVMVEAQLYLYWAYATHNVESTSYIRNLAYYMQKIEKDPLFQGLSAGVRQRFDDVKSKLPTSLQQFFFEPYFCLLNRHYSEFFYMTDAIEIDDKRRYVFTWREPHKVGPNGRWQHNITELSYPDSGYLDLKVALRALDIYMYREREVENLQNMIVGWRPGDVPDTGRWSMELVDDKFLRFTQSGYIMCASSNIYSPERRFVFTFSDGQKSAECQWLAKECPN